MNIFRTNTQDYLFTYISFVFQNCSFTLWYFKVKISSFETDRTAFFSQSTIYKVHSWGTDEACNEHILRLVVQFFWRSRLLNNTSFHNHDTVTHCHSFDLVMRYIDTSSFKAFYQFSNFRTHLTAQFSIQVRKRFVHQEYLWIADNRTSQGNTLTLTTGESFWFAIKQMLDVENFCSFANALIDFFFLHFAKFQAKCHVLVNVHMWVQRVGLEYHRDVAIFRCYVINDTIANVQFTFRNFFKTCDHTQCS
ncbi:hypothetical protein D3C78_780540 [compost metagenome]